MFKLRFHFMHWQLTSPDGTVSYHASTAPTGVRCQYNPREVPNWVNADNHRLTKIVTHQSHLYAV